jgi:transcriptional regulator with PAS, ATPase and Fis domain
VVKLRPTQDVIKRERAEPLIKQFFAREILNWEKHRPGDLSKAFATYRMILEVHHWQRTMKRDEAIRKAAEQLGVSARTIYSRLKKLRP